jgi:hypothetical protein
METTKLIWIETAMSALHVLMAIAYAAAAIVHMQG